MISPSTSRLVSTLVPGLQVHPHINRRAEVARQTQGGVRRDAPLAQDDLIDPIAFPFALRRIPASSSIVWFCLNHAMSDNGDREDEFPAPPESSGPDPRHVNRHIRNALLVLGLLLFLGLVAIVAAPFVEIHRFQTILAQTDALLATGQPTEALRLLAPMEAAVSFHPASLQEFHCQTIRCYVRTDRLTDAARTARWMLEMPAPVPGPARRPRSAIEIPDAIASDADWLCDRILSALVRDANAWDPWAGYKAFMGEISAHGDQAVLMEWADRLDREHPGNPIVRHVQLGGAPRTVAATVEPPRPPPTLARPPRREIASAPPIPAPVSTSSPPPVSLPVPPPPPTASSAAGSERPAAHWGVVSQAQVPVYNRRGDRTMRLAAGTLVDIQAIETISQEQWADCAFTDGGISISGMLVRLADLEVRAGPLADADPKEKDLRVRRIKLAMQIAKLKEETVWSGDGEDGVSYRTARERYDSFWKETEELKRQMDRESGARRMQIIDKLRKMKAEEVPLRQQLEAATKALEAARRKTAPSDANPELSKLEQELQSVERDLGRF